MSQRSDNTSQASVASSQVEASAYTTTLQYNGIVFEYEEYPQNAPWFNDMNQACWKSLIDIVTTRLNIDNEFRNALAPGFNVHFITNGYKDNEIIQLAIDTLGQVKRMAAAGENSAWRNLMIGLCTHFDFYTQFSYSQDSMWSYDLWPQATYRWQLVEPKPAFAFGILFAPLSPEHILAMQLSELTTPPVSPFGHDPGGIAFPFLILESTSPKGSLQTSQKRLANGLIKALDIVTSLGLQNQLFVIGICQVTFNYEMYLGYSSEQVVIPGIPRRVCSQHYEGEIADLDQYHVNLISTADLRKLEDTIRFLRFLKDVQFYAQNHFIPRVTSRLNDLGKVVPAT